ncbi:MAG TPA: transporter substrate-binding domain-containing protein [Aliidongia sp.]|uniref:substrate-binding periplasmic protein n=1 Tax=Aliidongia sp. TaxID=1914230 RepID=UPI002DDCE0D7|nr:transporter substrate-binding domain-containing protein [Aliidongia sp.]HEV2677957.1 transporter substrate-binding domain-containing protein [Aliidongia sp.]
MRRTLALTALALLLLVLGGRALAVDLVIEAEETPPESFEIDGEMGGITGEVLKQALARSHVTASIAPVPWQRAYNDALATPQTCAYPTTVTDERLPLFKWAGPLTRNDWVLIGTSEGGIHLDRLEDARRYRIGVYQGDAREDFFRKAGGFQVETVNSNELNLTRLQAGRIDLWAASVYTLWYERRHGAANLKVVLPFRSVTLSLACNKSVPDDVIARLNHAIADLIADGTTDRIEAPYR